MQLKKITGNKIESFRLYLRAGEKSENTIKKYIRDVTVFAKSRGGAADKSAVLEYKAELCKKYRPASVNSMLSSLNAFFIFAKMPELCVKTLKIQRRIFADRARELTKADYNKLVAAAKRCGDERLCRLMQTIGSTGVRISELEYITVEAVRAGRAVVNCKGKIRRILLPSQLCGILKAYAKKRKIKNGAVFVTSSGKPLDRSNVWKMLKRLCTAAGVAKTRVFPHNFRHLFARTFYAAEKDIVRLADILGHSSINTTRIYTIETDEIHRQQIQRLGLLKC